MQNGFALILALFTALAVAQVQDHPEPENPNQTKLHALKNITRFAFGSCNNQNEAQPLWSDMLLTKPELFIWNGDSIYADWDTRYDIKASYEKQKANPGYKAVTDLTPVLGTWDDHDYSWNDADGTFKDKVRSQQLLLDFLDEPAESPRRRQEGVYTSYEFGDPEKRVKFILLDNRYFKNLEADSPLLGKKQWDWLEGQLKNSTAKIHFILTGLPVFSPLLPYSEEWWHYPAEVNRMLKLLGNHRPKGVVFLTGDKHFGTIYKSYGHLEMISSGMTHVVTSRAWWYLGRKFPVTWFGLNYGLVDIAWDGETPLLTLGFRSYDHRDIHKQKYRWQQDTWIRQ